MKIKLSKLASIKLDLILEYLANEWSLKSKIKFLKKVNDIITVLKENPNLFPKSDIQGSLHRCVINKQVSMLYLIKKDTIFIVTIFDNREDPNKIKVEIKKHFS